MISATFGSVNQKGVIAAPSALIHARLRGGAGRFCPEQKYTAN